MKKSYWKLIAKSAMSEMVDMENVIKRLRADERRSNKAFEELSNRLDEEHEKHTKAVERLNAAHTELVFRLRGEIDHLHSASQEVRIQAATVGDWEAIKAEREQLRNENAELRRQKADNEALSLELRRIKDAHRKALLANYEYKKRLGITPNPDPRTRKRRSNGQPTA